MMAGWLGNRYRIRNTDTYLSNQLNYYENMARLRQERIVAIDSGVIHINQRSYKSTPARIEQIKNLLGKAHSIYPLGGVAWRVKKG